ncbi:MAG: YfhO family protein [Chloroflexi bacterium]|nr:YfhO family protein [Chloroflexota bacterium]
MGDHLESERRSTRTWRRLLGLTLGSPTHQPDRLALIALVALWLLFFWRLFTPVAADQASLKQGDFSGQFVAFAGYQYTRLADGEIPLWNPYNNGGLPFIADPQAAVFYPPRLLTIGLSAAAGGWSYHALELEMTAHVLAYTLLMYLFVRRLTGSAFGGFIAAVIGGYGGFLSGYPPLQLAILESAIWLPLAALGIHESARGEGFRPGWLLLTGLGLGLSWLAGHSQTSFLLTYLLIAYFAYTVYSKRLPWTIFVAGTAGFGALAGGLAAVTLLPGFEYLGHTARIGLTFEAKGNGFPFQDIIQFLFPGIVSLWSPLYVGFVGLVLALIALRRGLPERWFWAGVVIFALIWSFGANSVLYPLLYNGVPGLRYFRGQERAAYLVANGLAILAGMGAAQILMWQGMRDYVFALRLRVILSRTMQFSLLFVALILVAWLFNPDNLSSVIGPAVLAVGMIALVFLLLPPLLAHPRPHWLFWILGILLVFELFTFNMDTPSNYDPIPPTEQINIDPPPLIEAAADPPFRVDGARGLTDNYGSLYGVADMRGISPLFLDGPFAIIEGDLPDEIAWELFAVRDVYSDWEQLTVPAQIIAAGTDRYGPVNLHRLADPRPFALLMYDYVIADSDAFAYAYLRDPNFVPRRTITLAHAPGIESDPRDSLPATVTEFAPEAITIRASTPQSAILSIALPHYPGWAATVNNAPAELLRAYGGLSAVIVPAGDHTIRLTYDPLTYRVGALISLFAWTGLGILAAIFAWIRVRNRVRSRRDAVTELSTNVGRES